MKLTEAKLKQMILETMQRSKNYEKLKTLMVTSEGYIQAESLYEMVRGTFEEEEQMHMDIFFKPLILARERKAAEERYREAYGNYKAQIHLYLGEMSASQENMVYELFEKMNLAESEMNDKKEELHRSYENLSSHVYNNPSEAPDNLPTVVSDALWMTLKGSTRIKS